MSMNIGIMFPILIFHYIFIATCSGSCVYESKTYVDGDIWNSSCSICQCQSKTVSCTKIACPVIDCLNSELSHDSCCPQCVALKKSCYEGSTIYAHNDVWRRSSNCILHQCQDGTIVPFVIQCLPTICPKGEKLSSVPGKCCPKCIPDCSIGKTESESTADCKHHEVNVSKDCISVPGLKEKLAYFNRDPCILCINDDGEENCYSPKCPLCIQGASFQGLSTCCSCPKNMCAKECYKCLEANPGICLDCSDLSKVLHEGKCIEKCPDGYFSNEINQCKNCSTSCLTCFGNMSSQCSGCKDGYLLQKGRCVENCDANFYLSGKYCMECHESCLTCEGPNANDCLVCSLPGQLLQDGKCVDSCVGHFYVLDSACLECNESCSKCLRDGSCQYCEDDFYLEEEICVPECTGGYYKFIDAYCLPCNAECQTCFGPLPFQCTSCSFGQFLLENSCVVDCGQGYFGDLGAGICRTCHPDCRTCLGGSSNDKCLTCTSGYLLPYVGTHFGRCIENCPKGYYLTDNGICAFCHDTCETCFGPNEADCTSCISSLLFKNERCLPHCSNGYFQNNRICYACHPSCATCYGFNNDECSTCPIGRTFQYEKCITACGEGSYMNSEGLCSDCHLSCSDCMLNSTESEAIQCLECKNQQQSILHEQCISECHPNFYLDSYRICQECHPTCATCEKHGANACVSCWNGYFLTPLGTCKANCHFGYFPSNGICEACSTNCHQCYSKSRCMKCKGDLVLQNGECNPQCSDHHYVDGISRRCTECSWKCNSCHGPSDEDCTSCIAGKFFQDGTCVKNCSDGFFVKGNNICEKCDLKCKTCSILNKCTSCDLPLLLRDGECVDDCGSGHYADFEELECKSCGLGCGYCLSHEKCDLCAKGFYLFETACQRRCPEFLHDDPISRICKTNLGVQSIRIDSNLMFQVGQSILISTSLLNASDADTDEKIFIIIYNLPKNGQLIKMSDKGEEMAVSVGSNFTSRQLEDGWVFFKHSEGKAPQGELLLKISDGHLSSEEISLPLQMASKYSPQIGQVNYIIVPEDSLFLINSSILHIEDRDNIADITLNVIKGPCSGQLLKIPEEKEIPSVSYEEFSQNMLAFKGFTSGVVQEDSFVIQAFDGFNSHVTDIKVIVLPKLIKDLIVVHNKPFYMNFGIASALTNELLLSVGENLQPENIQYTIDTTRNPSIGKFFKKTNFNTLSEINGKRISFTQNDVNNNAVLYNHPVNSSIKIIKIMVTNKKSMYETKLDFEIRELKPEFDAPLENNQFGMMVLQNHPATITNDHLLVQLNGVSSNDIVYMITKKLLKEEGVLENLNQPGIKLQSFTQTDIDNLKVVYHPPPYGGSSEKQFLFQFVVIEAKSGSQLSAIQNFTITVSPPNSDFTSPASSIDHEATFPVSQGQSVGLGYNWLSTVGHEIPDDQLEVELTNAPIHGTLVQISGSSRTEIYEGDGFSFTSIINGMHYEHDGSDTLHDSAIFSIMGGRHSSLNRVKFVISPNDRVSPVSLDSTTFMGSVIEGKFLTLQRYHLAFTDLVSGDADIVLTLLGMPNYGILEKLENGLYNLLRPKDQFTQQDINDNLIRYSANTSIGDDAIRDFLYFDVSDAGGNVNPSQVLTMKVKPKKKEPPVLKIISDVKVNESGDTVIQPNILTIFDPDSPPSELMVKIEKQPVYGFIENARPILGAEISFIRLPIPAFPYVDLVEGYIRYYFQPGLRDVEPDQDAMYIYVNDGYLNSTTHRVNFTIRPVKDETPHVFTDSLFVALGGYAKILNSTLSVIDGDTKAENITITFDSLPRKGVLKKITYPLNFKTSQIISSQDSISFQDVLDGLLLYMHGDGNSNDNDTFTVVVGDGRHSVLATVNIVTVVTDREVPFLLRNLGLEISPGNSSIINNATLYASDADSSNNLLVYTLTSNPTAGQLFLFQNEKYHLLSQNFHNSEPHSFTQNDINQHLLLYQHNLSEATGMHFFKFSVSDPANNTLLDQAFYITISEDIFPPMITRNTGLKVNEKSHECITSEMLSAFDEHQKNLDLVFSITSQPTLGHLEHKGRKGTPITKFFMSDLKSKEVCYFHTSASPISLDSFTFVLSDGKNSVLQTFYINITSIYDYLPTIKISPLKLKEGTRKVITEFEMDVSDKDTNDKDITIKIIKHPVHGNLRNSNDLQVELFTIRDIKNNKIYYLHDDSEDSEDNFTMTVSDDFNTKFILIGNNINTTMEGPITFPIKIMQVDDLPPKLMKNEVMRGLKLHHGQRMNTITKEILYSEDLDTEDNDILYSITLRPRLGLLQLSTKAGKKINNFTQRDIIDGKIQYILRRDDLTSTEDTFIFSVEDTKPNKIFNNIFKIEWTRVNLNSSYFNVSESSGFIEIPVIRTGSSLDEKDFVSCKIISIKPNAFKNRIIPVTNEVLFEVNDTLRHCIFKIHDDFKFDGRTQFKILLQSKSLLGLPHAALLDIFDEEDEPLISFIQSSFRVNETESYFDFLVIRKGDLRHELSLMCTTTNINAQGSNEFGLETGSDFIGRNTDYKSFITFPIGVSETMCSVKIIDDNLYESEEKFHLILSNPHPYGKLYENTTAVVIINGPNDVPQVHLRKEHSEFLKGQRNLSVSVIRDGVDLTKDCLVMCGARISTDSGEFSTYIQEIKFKPFSTSSDCKFTFDEENMLAVEQEKITVFLNSSVGCVLSDPSNLVYPVIKVKINPIVEFSATLLAVREDSTSIQVPVSRAENLSQNSTLYCITHDGTAVSREDFEERYLARKSSIITFSPEQKESFCTIKIYDDDIYEDTESFKVELISHKIDAETQIGEKSIAVIEIKDPEDATVIQLKEDEYIVPQHMFPNNISTFIIVPVVRIGDVRMTSKVRVSTIEGSATSGMDYYAKSKLITFLPGERKKHFKIEILYNKQRNWAVYFTVILGPDDVLNANIGNISKAVVRIASVSNTESLILPAVPIVVSLLYFENVSRGMIENPKSGYPLICVTPCDPNYPEYTTTQKLCQGSDINASTISYSWEIAMPMDQENMSPFATVSHSTLFTSALHKILDSIYFRPQERIRCVAQPKDAKGHLGIPLHSKAVKISSERGFCHSTITSIHSSLSLRSQPFTATLNYLNSSDFHHPNKLHIHIEIPHEDGLFPLMSTYPLHNIEFLLTQNIYRQQHICSNLQSASTDPENNLSFLKSFVPTKKDINLAFPYYGEQCDKDALLLYQHLDLKKCKWSFDAWYTMAELVEFCGGTVTSDFKARDTDQTYSTVLLPLYVTYVFATAPTGWTSVEHRTEMEFSFYYDTFLWKSAAHSDGSLNATIGIVRVGTNVDGHMFFEFKTVAKFYGCFVFDHHTLPGIQSYVSTPTNLDNSFQLKLIWSEQTFDGPIQFWRATSSYNQRDYSGYYALHLIPCKAASSGLQSMYNGYKYLPCIAQPPEKFELPLSYQQSNRPMPATYALETFFQIFNSKNLFRLNPFENSPDFQYVEHKGVFSKGETIYGRVFWRPQQGLESAYKLNINEIIICTGKSGFVPEYDPTGKISGKGYQYGCLLPNRHLKYKFVLLDTHDPDSITKEIRGVPFHAKFVQDIPEFSSLSDRQGVDGFVFNIDPLYEISSSQQWFLQVIYHIKPTQKTRLKRSVNDPELSTLQDEKGSNVRRILLAHSEPKYTYPDTMVEEHQALYVYFGLHHLLYILSGMLIVLGIIIIRSKINFRKMLTFSNVSRNSYSFCGVFDTAKNSQGNEICDEKVKKKEIYKVKVYSQKNHLQSVRDSLETEV